MLYFSNDRDILKYEPKLFCELYPKGQVLSHGAGGTLSGTTFTKAGENFVSSQVSAGCVIYLKSATSAIDAAFEIVSVNSATQLTVSVLRVNETDDAISPKADAADYAYRIATFAPQANEVLVQLTQYFGIRPGNPDSYYSADDLLDASVLRQTSVYAVIAAAYASYSTGAGDDDSLWYKSFHYRRLFEKTKDRCRIDIDLGKDGIKDLSRFASSPKMMRD
jgi:hypothetical protein